MVGEEKFVERVNGYGKAKTPFLVLVDYTGNNPQVFPLDNLPKNIWVTTPQMRYDAGMTVDKPQIEIAIKHVPFDVYRKSFGIVQEHLHAGNTYLTNLTFSTEITTNFSLEEIYAVSQAPYKLKFKDEFVIFTPEKFVEIRDNRITTFPMKGTIDAAVPNAREIILNDKKETSEHATIVDLLRNDLSKVASNVQVKRYRYTDTVYTHNKALLQVSSEIQGALPANWRDNLGRIIYELLPAGSVTGAPKKKTLEIIAEAENYKRGYYTGVFGIFDGDSFNSAVNIRFIQQENGRMYYKSGGGVTALSDMESEYNELNQKIYVPVSRVDKN